MADIQQQYNTEIRQLIERARSSFLTTASLARLYVPLLRLLLKDGATTPRAVDLSEQYYHHHEKPVTAARLEPHFRGDFSWPVEQVPTSSTNNSQTPWIEDTCDQFEFPELPDGCVRILELQASASSDDPVKCLLHQKSIRDLSDYEVLSCTGAVSSVTLPVTFDGRSFELPVALWDALRQVRLQDESRFLWLEELCLNPTNAANREHKAGLKHHIYRQATRALVWLGVDDEESQLVFAHLDRCRAQKRLNWDNYGGQAKEAFLQLSRRPWFHRLESALLLAACPEVVLLCGSNTPCSLPELVKCTSFRSDYHPLYGIFGPNHLQLLAELGEQRHIQNALRFCQYIKKDGDGTADIFGILKDLIASDLPDSSDLNQTLTLKTITDRQDITILHWGAAGRSRASGTPSWVPALPYGSSVAPLPRVFGSFSYRNEYPWTLLPGWEAGSGGSLSLKGYFCGKIEAVGEALAFDKARVCETSTCPDVEALRKVIRSWEEVCVGHLGKPGKKRFWQPLADAFADTIHAEDAKEQSDPYTERPGVSIHAGDFVEWYSQYGSGILAKHEPEYFDTLETAKKWVVEIQPEVDHVYRLQESCAYYTENVERAIIGRRLFVTDDGSLGLAPKDVEAGDQLVFFPGGRYAFVIRPNVDGRGYELLGDCFVYDMNVFKLVEAGRVQDVVLV